MNSKSTEEIGGNCSSLEVFESRESVHMHMGIKNKFVFIVRNGLLHSGWEQIFDLSLKPVFM